MNKHINLVLSIMVAIIGAVSCNENAGIRHQSDDEAVETKLHKDYIKDDMIDGYKLSLGDVSDLLDQDLTIEKAKQFFGDQAIIDEDGRSLKLTYAINSNDLYENGMRITTITLVFIEGKFNKASIGFTGYTE
jgi:hypothetical protein